MITVRESDTPFDDVASPTTVATPSCCCCCCCCLATISSATVGAARIVHRDSIEGANAEPGRSAAGYVFLATCLPIALLVFAGFASAYIEEQINGSWWIGIGLAVLLGIGAFAGLRIAAGAEPGAAFAGSVGVMVVYPILLLVEVFAVLFTVGIFWLSIPLWIWLVVKGTRVTPPGHTEWAMTTPIPPPPSHPIDLPGTPSLDDDQ